jgi:predicted nucleotidyltransferase
MNLLKSTPSTTSHTTLDEVVKLLTKNGDVESILIVGSGANSTFHEYSDYDLALITRHLPDNLMGIVTNIEGKLAEIFFYSKPEIENILQKDPIDPLTKEGWIFNWIRTGKIILDRSRYLKKLKEKSLKINLDNVTPQRIYDTWYKINYNYLQNKRYFDSRREEYLDALEIRLMYSLAEVIAGYFNLRNMNWRGEKAAIKWLKNNDSNFYLLFKSYTKERLLENKFKLYEEMAQKSLEPVNGIIPPASIMVMSNNTNLDSLHSSLRFWEKLIA